MEGISEIWLEWWISDPFDSEADQALKGSSDLQKFSTALLTQRFYKKSWVQYDTCTTVVVWLCSKYRTRIKICQLFNLNCSSPAAAKIISHCLTGDLFYRFLFSEIAPNSHNCRIRSRPSQLQKNIKNVTALLRVTHFWDHNFATFTLNELFSDIHWALQKKLKRISISPSNFLAESTVS